MNAKVNPLVATALIGVTLLAGWWAIVYKESLKDWFFFRSYEPSFEVESLAERAGMNELGQRLFYRADPELVSQSEIGDLCIGVDNIGCLVTGPKIYVLAYDSQDDTERDLATVTSAHEMLHMAYFRLSDDEREYVDELVAAEVTKAGKEIERELELYDELERADEAHSIVGTEVGNVSAALIAHYAQYFENRSDVLQAHSGTKGLLRCRARGACR